MYKKVAIALSHLQPPDITTIILSFTRIIRLLQVPIPSLGQGLCPLLQGEVPSGIGRGSNVLNLKMRTDMPGSDTHMEYRMCEDLCSKNESTSKCAGTALDFLGSEWGAPPHLLPQPQEGPLQAQGLCHA